MDTNEAVRPDIPSELLGAYDEAVAEVFEAWHDRPVEAVKKDFPYSDVALLGNGQSVRYADLGPGADADPSQTTVLFLPVAKVWNLETYITAEVIRELAAPNGRMLVFPNSHLDQRAFLFSDKERDALKDGDLRPVDDRRLRVFDKLGITSINLMLGHSFGATSAASLAARAADHVALGAHLFDEAPNTFRPSRTHADINRAMFRERKLVPRNLQGMEIQAFDELTHANSPTRRTLLLARFAIGARLDPVNADINNVFLGDSFFGNVGKLLNGNPAVTVLVSNAAKSTVCDNQATEAFVKELNTPRAGYQSYDGYHVTGGSSPWPLGLLARQALLMQTATSQP